MALQELQVDTSPFSEDDSFRQFDFQMSEAVHSSGSSYSAQPQNPTYSDPYSDEGALNFMVEKDFSKTVGLFPEQLPQTTTATVTSPKYLDTQSYEGSFPAYSGTSEKCCYGPLSYSLPSYTFQNAFTQKDSEIDPYPKTSDTQPYSLYQQQQHDTHALPTSREAGSPLTRRSDAHQSGGLSVYVTYPQSFYTGSPIHTDAHDVSRHEVGYSTSGRQGIMYGGASGPSSSRHFRRRPSQIIPMPPPTPEREELSEFVIQSPKTPTTSNWTRSSPSREGSQKESLLCAVCSNNAVGQLCVSACEGCKGVFKRSSSGAQTGTESYPQTLKQGDVSVEGADIGVFSGPDFNMALQRSSSGAQTGTESYLQTLIQGDVSVEGADIGVFSGPDFIMALQELQVNTSIFSEDDLFRQFDFQMPEAVQSSVSSYSDHNPTYSKTYSDKGALNFMMEKDSSNTVGLFPEQLPQTTTATVTSSKNLDTQSYEGSFPAYSGNSEKCCYGPQSYSLPSRTSQNAFSQRDSGIDPYPKTSDTQPYSLYQQQQQHQYHHQQQHHHSIGSNTSEDSKQNIQLYQSHQMFTTHANSHALPTLCEAGSPLICKSDARQRMELSKFVTQSPKTPTTLACTRSSPGREGSKKQCLLCAVCGDISNCKNYSVRTCEGCKSFFKRTVQKGLKYECFVGKNCPVNKQRRKFCQFCRFQKCLVVGMTQEGEFEFELTQFEDISDVRTGSLKGKRGRLPPKPPKLKSPQEVPPSPPVSLITLLVRAHVDTSPDIQNLDYSKYKVSQPDDSPSTDAYRMFYDLLLQSTAILHNWADKLPGFTELCKEDQELLFQSATKELLILRMAYRIEMNEENIIFDNGVVLHRNQCYQTFGDRINSIIEFGQSMHRMAIDLSAVACMAALSLVTFRHGLKEVEKMEDLQKKILDCLKVHCTFNSEAKEKQDYFPFICGRIADLRSLSGPCLSLKAFLIK